MLSGSIRPSGSRQSQEARRNPRSPQPAELLFQHFGSQRAFFCRLKGLGRLHGTSVFRTGNRQGFPDGPGTCQMEGNGGFLQVFPHFFQLRVQGRIIRFPEFLPGFNPAPVNTGCLSVEKKAVSLHFPDTSALFFIAVFPCINDEAVPGRERNAPFRPDIQPALTAVHNDACVGAPLFTVAAVGQTRVVRPVQPAGGEAA